jgi:hypothetical protein
MNLVLNLGPELESRLRQKAVQDGIEPEAFVIKLLEDQFASKSPEAMTESELLVEASRGLPPAVWQRYHELIDRTQQQSIDEAEHREFIELNELVETTHARRMACATELAMRRGVPLRGLMDELGFPNYSGA